MKRKITISQSIRVLLIGIFASSLMMISKNTFAGNTVAVSSASQVGTAFLSANATNVIVSQFTITTGSTGTATINYIAEAVTGSYTSGDITSAKLYCNTTGTTFSGATQIGSTITPAGAPETFTFSSLAQGMTTGGKTYTYFIVVALASGATSGHTLTMSAISSVGTSGTGINFTAASASVTGSVTASGTETIQAAQSVISSPSQVGATTIYTGAGNNVISQFQVSEGQASPTGVLSAIAVVTGGTYASTDVTAFQLYASTTNSLVGANPLGTSQSSVSGNGETITFSSLALTIPAGTEYFFITATLSGNANVTSNSISASAIANGGFTFTTGTNSGSVTAGGAATISAPVAFAPAVSYTVETFETANGSTNGTLQALPDGWTISGAQAVNWGASTQHVSTAYSPNLLYGAFSGGANLGDGATGTPVLGTAAVITTPDINTTGLDPAHNLNLDFGYYYSAQWDASITIDYSVNGGTAWTNLVPATNAGASGSAIPGTNPFEGTAATWVAYSGQPSAVTTLPGSTCAGITNLRIRFTINRSTVSGNFHIDDVTIGGTSLNPTITATPASITSLYTALGGTPQYLGGTYTVSGTSLGTNPIVITPPTGVEVSQDNSTWIDNPSTISLSPTSGAVSATTIYVRLASSNSAGAFASANITNTCSTTGSNNPNVAASGTVFAAASAFTAGNIAAERTLAGGVTVIDEYTTSGTLVQTIPLPFTGANQFYDGTSSSEGADALSVDGQYIITTGYSSATTDAGTLPANPRVFARINSSGAVDVSTSINDGTATAGNMRNAVSIDGSGFWLSDNNSTNNPDIYQAYGATSGETYFQGTSISSLGGTALTNTRGIGLFDGSLYATIGSTVYQVPGVPTSNGTNASALTGIPSGGEGAKSVGFVMFDVDPAVAGPDVMYIADLGSNFTKNTAYSTNTAGTYGVFKYVNNGTTWVNKGKIVGPATGITGKVVGNDIVLYAIVNTTSTTDTLYTITDLGAGNASTYTGNISNNGSTFADVIGSYVAASATGTDFMGITFTPSAPGVATTTATSGTSVGNPIVASSSVNNLVYQFSLTNNSGTNAAYLTGVTFTPAGTNTAADFSAFKLWYSPSSTFSTSTAFVVSTATPTGSGTPFTFNTGLSIAPSATGYFYYTANIAVSPTGNDDLTLTNPTDASFTFTDGGSEVSGNFSTTIGDLLINPVPTVSASVSAVSGFYTTRGTASPSQNFTVSGLYLAANETAQFTTGTNFEFSTDNATWQSGATQLSYVPASETVTTAALYVRIKASATVNVVSDVITVTSAGGNSVTVNVSGYVGKPFTSGNLLVSRAGTGVAVLSSAATPAFLDEYTTSGTLVQTIPLPTLVNGSNLICAQSGTASTVGLDHLSLDGQYYLSTGFNAPIGTASVTGTANSTNSGTVDRVVARVDYNANINTTTHLSDGYNSGLIRSAASIDGTSFYTSGRADQAPQGTDGGARWINLGASTSTQLSSSLNEETRNINILSSQLYVSNPTQGSVTSGINSIGVGVGNTSGQSVTSLLTGSSVTPYGFVGFNTSNTVNGVDVIYIADQTNGVYKYVQYPTGTWTQAGQLTGSANGITGKVVGGNIVLYVVSGARGTSGNTVYTFTDPVGHATITGSGTAITAAGTLVATAATNTTFSSLDFVPVALGGTPSVAVTSPGPAAGGILPGSSHDVVYELTMTPSVANAIVTSVTLPLTGTYTTNDLTANAFELWYSQANSFDTTAVQIGKDAFIASGSNATFSIAQQLPLGAPGYFYFTVNAKASPTVGDNIQVSTFTPSANITLADNGTVTGTAAGGGLQTIDACLNSSGVAYAGGGSTNNTNTVICSGTAASIGLHTFLGTVQWQQSTTNNGTDWANVTTGTGSATATYVTAPLTTTTYYRALVTNSCFVVSSNTVTVFVSAAPTVTLTNLTPTSVSAAFTPFAVNTGVTYSLTYSGSAGTGTINPAGSPQAINGLTSGSTLNVTVTQVAPAGCSVNGSASINTELAAPTLTLSAATTVGFTASWTPVTGATSYQLFYKTTAGGTSYSILTTSSTTATITKLYPGDTYLAYVIAIESGFTGTPSTEQYITTLPNSSPCAIPTISAVSNCPNQITVTLSGSPGLYRLTLSRMSPNPTSGATYNVSGGTINITLGVQYASSIWQVVVSSNCGNGSFSTIASPVYVIIKAACPALQNLVLSTPTCLGFEATWNANNCSGSLVDYYLYVQHSGSLSYNAYNVGTNNYVDANWLAASTWKAYVVSVACNGAVSGASTIQTITTGVGCRTENTDEADNNAVDNTVEQGNASMNIYPNPTSGNFMVNVFTKEKADETVQIEMVNTLGQVVYTVIAPVNNGISNNVFQVPGNVASGMYLIRTVAGGESMTKQIIYNR